MRLIAAWLALASMCASAQTSAASLASEEVAARQALIPVSLARAPADLIVRDARMLDVFTGHWLEHQDIVIAGDRIAWTGPTGRWPGTAKAEIDAKGYTLVPGFGESHKHIESSYLAPEYEAALVIPHGNTWTVEGSHELSNVVGEHNVDFWLRAEAAGSPLSIFPAIGSATPPTEYETSGGWYGFDEMQAFLDTDLRVVALGEVMDWTSVITPGTEGHDRIWAMIEATFANRAQVEGHGAGLYSLEEINGFAAAGLASDHEVRQNAEGLEKLRRGVFLEVRVDTARTLFPYLLAEGITDFSNVSVTTDDRDVFATQQLGSMDYNIRIAIEAGVPPADAYRMGSYNTARHFRIEHLVGAIAPGRYADIVFLDDVEAVSVAQVIAKGKLAAKDGEYLLPIPEIEYPEWARGTFDTGRPIVASDLRIEAPEGRETADVALLRPFYFAPELPTSTLPATNGVLLADPARGVSKVAVVDRYHGTPSVSRMFWKGVGPSTPGSALASSQMHDIHNIWIVGNDDAAMALAANTVADMDGGWVLVSGGEVVATVRLELAGLISQRPVDAVAADMEALHAAADRMEWIGAPGLPERMRFAFLTASPWKWQLVAPYAENPGGLVDVTSGRTHPVAW